jgi:hypothetical protein
MSARRLSLGCAAWGLLTVSSVHGCKGDEAVVVRSNEAAAPNAGNAAELGLGTLRVPLVTPDSLAFRLRNALFDIETLAGAPLVTLDGEIDPDAEALSTNLVQGFYRIVLHDGWVLERLEEDGTAAPVRAALVSPNPNNFAIRNERVTQVVYIFTTDTGLVLFGEGSAAVGIAFQDPATLASCDIVNQFGCAAGQTCLLADDIGNTFCATPGSLPAGSACTSEQCVLGAQCLAIDPARPLESECTLLCNPVLPPFGCDCQSLRFDEAVGVCGPPPSGTCDLLTQTGCAPEQACQFPGGSFGVCGAPGDVEAGGSCFGEECVAGLDCFGDDPAFGFSGTCVAFCDLAAPSCDFCVDVGTSDLGRCFL